MRVYTIDNGLQLEIHASMKAFEAQAGPSGWINPKYLHVVNTDHLKEFYDHPWEQGIIVYSDKEIRAHNILHGEFKRLKGV